MPVAAKTQRRLSAHSSSQPMMGFAYTCLCLTHMINCRTPTTISASETPPLENGRCCSAPPQVLSSSGSTPHRSRTPRCPQGRLTRPVHRPSCATAHCGGTLPVTSRARCPVLRASSTRSVVCAGSASAQRVWPSRLLDHKSTCVLVWSRGGPCIPWLQPRGFLAPMSVSTAAIQGYSNIAVMVIGERGAGCAALPFLCGFG